MIIHFMLTRVCNPSLFLPIQVSQVRELVEVKDVREVKEFINPYSRSGNEESSSMLYNIGHSFL